MRWIKLQNPSPTLPCKQHGGQATHYDTKRQALICQEELDNDDTEPGDRTMEEILAEAEDGGDQDPYPDPPVWDRL